MLCDQNISVLTGRCFVFGQWKIPLKKLSHSHVLLSFKKCRYCRMTSKGNIPKCCMFRLLSSNEFRSPNTPTSLCTLDNVKPHQPAPIFLANTHSDSVVEWEVSSLDETFSSFTRFDWTESRTKWYFTSMCLFRVLTEDVFAVSMVPKLSTPIPITSRNFESLMSLTNRESQIASLTAKHNAMYSASQVEVATHDCFLDFQLTAPQQLRRLHHLSTFVMFYSPPGRIGKSFDRFLFRCSRFKIQSCEALRSIVSWNC